MVGSLNLMQGYPRIVSKKDVNPLPKKPCEYPKTVTVVEIEGDKYVVDGSSRKTIYKVDENTGNLVYVTETIEGCFGGEPMSAKAAVEEIVRDSKLPMREGYTTYVGADGKIQYIKQNNVTNPTLPVNLS